MLEGAFGMCQHSAPLAQALRALLSDTPTLVSLGVVLLLIAGLIMVRYSPASLVAIGTIYNLAPEVCLRAVAVQIFFCCALLATVTACALRMYAPCVRPVRLLGKSLQNVFAVDALDASNRACPWCVLSRTCDASLLVPVSFHVGVEKRLFEFLVFFAVYWIACVI